MRDLRIKLYGDGGWVDIDVDSSTQIIENYELEKAESPTTNKDSVTYNIALPKTPNNIKFFKHIEEGSTLFDARKRIDAIMLSDGFIVERGYAALTSVNGSKYNITIYGGLGDFIYNLQTKEDGTKMKLSDIIKFDFIINRDFVKETWNKLGDSYTNDVSSYITFVPCYNSDPKSFSQDKILVNVDSDIAHFSNSFTKDGKTYTTVNGFGVAKLGSDKDEWGVRDLRSYNQRPAIRISKLVDSILGYQSGYTIKKGNWFNSEYYRKGYMVLPNINEANSNEKTATVLNSDISEKITATTRTKQRGLGTVNMASLGFDSEFTFTVSSKVSLPEGRYMRCSGPYKYQYTEWEQTTIENGEADMGNTLKYRIVAKDFSGNVLATSGWYGYEDTNQRTATITLSCYSSRVMLFVEYNYENTGKKPVVTPFLAYTKRYLNGTETFASATDVSVYGTDSVDVNVDFNVITSVRYTEGKRSNSKITEKNILNMDKTPAEILLGLIKAFGLLIIKDPVKKEISIIGRNEWLNDDEPVLLDDRIDEGKEITITPCVFNKHFHELAWQSTSTPYSTLYKDKYDAEYGTQTINTEYDFNSDTNKVLSSPFANVVTAKGVSTDYNTFFNGSEIVDPFLVNGYEWELFRNGNKESATVESIISKDDVKRWSQKRGSDMWEKMDLEGVSLALCFYNGKRKTADLYGNEIDFYVTDDDDTMYALNDGKPMYLYDRDLDFETELPQFSRYLTEHGNITLSWDFGKPQEIYMELSYGDNSTIYEQYWKDWYDSRRVSRKLSAYCNLEGLGEINKNFMRNTFIYKGQKWMMNKCEIYKSDPSLSKIELIRL